MKFQMLFHHPEVGIWGNSSFVGRFRVAGLNMWTQVKTCISKLPSTSFLGANHLPVWIWATLLSTNSLA